MKNEIAILMAAGLGTRMAPLTNKVPKPLVKVFNKPMIETVIDGLQKRGVRRIFVVVGYLKESFNYLLDKYQNISIVENKDYLTVNNISSIKAVCNLLGNEDCFICEADLYVSDDSIFQNNFDKSCYFGKYIEGQIDDWVIDQDSIGKITRLGKYGHDQFVMCGISYFKAKDIKIIRDAIEEAYKKIGYFENLFWDEVVNENLYKLNLSVFEVQNNQIVEIDSVKELSTFDCDYSKYNF